MRLGDYLNARGESARAFATRAGLTERLVQRVRRGDGCNARAALAIIRASVSEPTLLGGTVTLEDIVIHDGSRASA